MTCDILGSVCVLVASINPDFALIYAYVLGLCGVVVLALIYMAIKGIARREIRKAMKGYTMMRTVQPRDERGRFRKALGPGQVWTKP